jgi:hypothetical protein
MCIVAGETTGIDLARKPSSISCPIFGSAICRIAGDQVRLTRSASTRTRRPPRTTIIGTADADFDRRRHDAQD